MEKNMMSMEEIVKEEIIKKELVNKAKFILKTIEERLDRIHDERVRCCKVKNDYEIKLQEEYEKLLELKRICISIDEFRNVSQELLNSTGLFGGWR